MMAEQSLSVRQRLLAKIWRGCDPFENFPRNLYQSDRQGWSSSTHFYLDEAIAPAEVRVIVEVGVWKGRSVMHMAKQLQKDNRDAVIIAVDTWLGSWEHWIRERHLEELRLAQGYPHLFQVFMQNMCEQGLQNYVLPLPLDSVNAAHVLRHAEIVPDVIHIDAGHDFRAVSTDLEEWWPLLREGGVLVGDDYLAWPSVKRAFDAFFAARPAFALQSDANKCRVVKAAAG